MNARETLERAEDWLGWQEEDLSYGLRNAFDALRLFDYAQANPDLPEMADDWEPEDRIAAVGYDPLELALGGTYCEAETSGATAAAEAMQQARELLDSVAFVAKEGDTAKPIAAIDAVLSAA